MSYTGDTSREPADTDIAYRPHAFDPLTQPELFEGVLSRRIIAFLVDALMVIGPVVLFGVFVFVFGIVTLGLGWLLFWLIGPVFILWAVAYYAFTLGSPASATLGMRLMEIELRTWYGAPCYALLGGVRAVCFWVSVSVLTPFVLLVGLFNDRRRLLHDFLCGTVVINSAERAEALRRIR